MKLKFLVLAIITITVLIFSVSAFAYTDLNTNYPDYVEAINELTKKGVLSGYPDDTFRGANLVTRAEATKMIVSAFELKKLDGQVSKLLNDINDTWAEEYINIATSNGIIEGYEDETFRPQNTITYGEISAIIARLKKLNLVKNEDDNSWVTPYWRAMSEEGYFDNIVTNDLIPVANARRDNVALIIYNALTSEKPVANPEENKQPAEQKEEEKPTETADFDTAKIYFGKVDTAPYIRGKEYINVQNYNDEAWALFLKSNAVVPEDGSVVFYKIRKSKAVNLLKELKVADINDGFIVEKVEDDDDDGIKLKNHPTNLVLKDDDEFTFDGSEIKLTRLNYFELKIQKNKNNGNYEFVGGKETTKEDATFKKGDRIVIDADKKLFIIVKGLTTMEEI